jgi:hypothetical protein
MPLLGSAAVAMWWDVDPALRAEFEDWHSHEHFPERLRIPGFLRGSRWASVSGDDGFFVMYELEAYETLTSPHYRQRLDNPSPWSTKMMPHHRNMVRSQCRIVESCGGGVGGFTMTVHLSPQQDRHDALRKHLRNTLRELPALPGITGIHLLETATPKAPQTEEQKIRGGDAVADWILLLSGYDPEAILGVASGELADPSLTTAGALPNRMLSLYRLSYVMTPNDV